MLDKAKIKYISYEKFKRLAKIKKYTHDVRVNLVYNGLIFIGLAERKIGNSKYIETCAECAERIIKSQKIESGIVVYRKTPDRWGLDLVEAYLLNSDTDDTILTMFDKL